MKTAIIDVGGGLRGIYAAGVMDRLLDEDISFDLGIGVSSGSANVASFVSRQKGRNYDFYTVYSQREEYMSRKNIRAKGCFLDVQYIYGTLSNTDGENPFDFPAFCVNPMDYIAVATDVETGAAKYFGKQDMHLNYYNVLMASSAMPIACSPQDVSGRLYLDGEVADPVPLDKAFELGCEKVVLVLSRPINEKRDPDEDQHQAVRIRDKYPKAAEALSERANKYNEGVIQAKRLAAEGRMLIVSPDDLCGVDTFTNDIQAMDKLYWKGYADAAMIGNYLRH